jgi:hypothetical protein
MTQDLAIDQLVIGYFMVKRYLVIELIFKSGSIDQLARSLTSAPETVGPLKKYHGERPRGCGSAL